MLWFLICIGLLLAGYFIYGSIIERIFKINPSRPTPAHHMADGVDYVPMSKKKMIVRDIDRANLASRVPEENRGEWT